MNSLKHPHIRRLDTKKDLFPVAELIETCFGDFMDEDAWIYVRQIRRAARDQKLVYWTPGAGEMVSYPLNGFVWENTGEIIANLSLIPFNRNRQWVYLIANVAVDPEHRNKGIAQELTKFAINHLKTQKVSAAWLQVREDNEIAKNLYLKYGFEEITRRANWLSAEPFQPNIIQNNAVAILPRNKGAWPAHHQWLDQIYPEELRWYLPFNIPHFQPSLLNTIKSLLDKDQMSHWAGYYQDELIGVVSIEKSRQAADRLWIAPKENYQEVIIRHLLPFARLQHNLNRQLNVNFPAHQGISAFQAAGFKLLNNLIWMEAKLT
ncbi:MAG: GNAT family N-acetyltransferase [Anaerolineaceae bacterium]|nr:GNAT family N-acetyltransferase [Anaerolineaceae bacterium]